MSEWTNDDTSVDGNVTMKECEDARRRFIANVKQSSPIYRSAE